jgi:hypothetical protein
VIWDQWFTVSGPDGAHLAYYRERFEEQGDHYVYRIDRSTRAGEKFVDETSEAMARSRPALDPMAFRYEGPAMQFEVGSAKAGRFRLTLKEKGKPEEIKMGLKWPPRAVLDSLLPVWLAEKSRQARPGRMISVFTVFPLGSADLAPHPVQVRFQTRDEFAKKHRAGKIEVIRSAGPGNAQSISTSTSSTLSSHETWWIDVRGLPIRIERADQSVIERIEGETQARAFLERST